MRTSRLIVGVRFPRKRRCLVPDFPGVIGVRCFFPQRESRSRSGLLPLESPWRYCRLIRARWGKCRAPHHVTTVLSLGRRMSGVFVSMRRTLLSCSSLARNGLIGLAGTLPLATPAWAVDAAFHDTL